MTAGVPPGPGAGTMTPAEREARWGLHTRFAIEAGSEDEARIILGQALARLKPDLPLRGEPVIHPRHRRQLVRPWPFCICSGSWVQASWRSVVGEAPRSGTPDPAHWRA